MNNVITTTRMNTSYGLIICIAAYFFSQTDAQSTADNIIDGGIPHMNNKLDDLLTQLIKDFVKNSDGNNGVNKHKVPLSLLSKRSGSLGYNGLTGDIHQRLANVREEIKGLIGPARKSVEEEIAKNNRDKILLALVNFLGATFGVLLNSMGPDGLTTFMSLPEGNQILVLAQLMYGYGYVGPFALEYEKTALDCGLLDYEQVEYEYSFIDHGYSEDPAVLTYFTTEAANQYKKALYCITSRKGTNSDARRLDALIDLQAELQRERL